jgi:hypothetical protein
MMALHMQEQIGYKDGIGNDCWFEKNFVVVFYKN